MSSIIQTKKVRRRTLDSLLQAPLQGLRSERCVRSMNAGTRGHDWEYFHSHHSYLKYALQTIIMVHFSKYRTMNNTTKKLVQGNANVPVLCGIATKCMCNTVWGTNTNT
jgi:hypothetical protein